MPNGKVYFVIVYGNKYNRSVFLAANKLIHRFCEMEFHINACHINY